MVCWDADAMRPVDVGLTPELPYFRITTARRTPAITYLHLFECDKFSVRFFVALLCDLQIQSTIAYVLMLFQLYADGNILLATIGCHSAS